MVLDSDNSTGPLPEIPGYRMIRLLGTGGMGRVYLALQQSLNRSVVIKVLNRLDDSPQTDSAARFEREAVLMAQGTHPNIVGVIDRGVVDGNSYIVMEYVDGGDLRSRLRPDHPMSVGEARPILSSIGRALTALHEKGIIHRDLKPKNILMDQAGTVRITDFGIAVPLDQIGELTNENISLGTLDYMAPEQRHRLDIDLRADQYAFSLVAYEILTGRRPLGIVGSPSDHNSQLTRHVDEVILRGLQEDPDDRFPTVAAFSQALDESLAECSTLFGSTGARLKRLGRFVSGRAGVPTRNSSERMPRRMVVLGMIVLLGAMAVFGLLRQFSPEIPSDSPTGMHNASGQPDLIEQAAALGYRVQDGALQVLLIRSRHDMHWTISKGTLDNGITPRETAAGEAFEESGVRGVLGSSPVGVYYYTKKDRWYRVTVFPFLVQEELSTWPEQFRGRRWCVIETAVNLVAEDGLRDLIRGFRVDPS